MDVKKFAIAVVVTYIAFAVVALVLDALFSGQMQSLNDLLLPEERRNLPYMMVAYLGYTVVFCYIYLQGHENKGMMEGVRYGLLIGLLIGSMRAVFFAITTITAMAAIIWIVMGIIVNVVGGAVLSAVYRGASAGDQSESASPALD